MLLLECNIPNIYLLLIIKEVTSLGDNLILNEMRKAKQISDSQQNVPTYTHMYIHLNRKIDQVDLKKNFKEPKRKL